MTDAKVTDALAMARWTAARAVPYLARGLWACTYVPSEEVATFAIDARWRVLCNPAFTLACAKDGSLPAALVHEALHNVLRHGPRAEMIHAEDRARWNKSGDCEINARIDEIPALHLPTCGIHARDFGWPDGLAAEEYYAQPSQGKPSPGQDEQGKPCACSGGSGAGAPHEAEKSLPGEGEEGPQGLDETEGDLVRAIVATQIKEAARTKPGSVPGGMLRWAEAQGEAAPLDWRTLAQARIRYATQARRGPSPSFARPSRRTAGPFVLPVYRQHEPRIAIVLDTSGSMSDADIATALGVVVDACNAIGHVTAQACDSDVGEAVEVRSIEDLRDYMTGGGGTDMVRGIAAAAEGNPDAIVVVTDGETPWPASAPDVPVVVVLTREPSYCGRPPAWAEVVQAYGGAS